MSLIRRAAAAFGLDTALVVAGVVLISAAASYLNPALALLVVGLACLLLGLAPHLRIRR